MFGGTCKNGFIAGLSARDLNNRTSSSSWVAGSLVLHKRIISQSMVIVMIVLLMASQLVS